MDEPTASLDPDIADKLLQLIEKLRKERNLSILYTSHNMDEVTRICDEVIFLDRGKIVAQDTPLELTKRIQTAELRIMFEGEKKTIQKFLQEEKQEHTFESSSTVIIKTEEKSIPNVIFKLSKLGIWITDLEIMKPNLEDVFLQIARGSTHENS